MIINLIKETIKKWQQDKVSRLAAALAFFTVLSIPSMLTLAILIAGQVIGESNARQFILGQAGSLVGSEARNALEVFLQTTNRPDGITLAAITSIAILFFSASGMLVQLQDALDTIWDVQADPEQGIIAIIKQRVFSFAVIVVIGLLVVLMLLTNMIVSNFGQSLETILPFSIAWARILTSATSFLIYILLIAILFKTIPNVEISWKDVGVGSLVTGLLLGLGIIGLNLYFQYRNPTASYGTAGSLMA
ncbi:MAG: YihY/virulence factor BrkB family protein, partial [Candidatus Promineifilaceae bacterium]